MTVGVLCVDNRKDSAVANPEGTMDRKSVLNEAYEIVNNRERKYAPPIIDFTAQARVLSGLLLARYGIDVEIEPDFIGLFMIGMKAIREAGSIKRDNLVDIPGYAECNDMILRGDTLADALAKWFHKDT